MNEKRRETQNAKREIEISSQVFSLMNRRNFTSQLLCLKVQANIYRPRRMRKRAN